MGSHREITEICSFANVDKEDRIFTFMRGIVRETDMRGIVRETDCLDVLCFKLEKT